MRLLFALIALLTLAAPASAQRAPARDWTTVAAKNAAGHYVIGNPVAKVKLVEYASMTCSHCAAFSVESAAVLKQRMIRSGSVSLEFRHFVFNALDLGAVVLARCGGPDRFAATTAYIYETQMSWLERGARFQQANAQRLAMYPLLGQLRALVDGAGLTQAVVARGLPLAAVDACFADQAEIERIARVAQAPPPGVTSTPTFFINGRQVARVDWAQLEPKLRAAGAR